MQAPVRRPGRPERPVDPGSSPQDAFAFALRRLREDSGSPSYRAMARRVPYAASTLARAASGDSLPHRDLAMAYVRACGGDEDEWRCRWDTAASHAASHGAQGPARPLDAAGPGQATLQDDGPAPAWRRRPVLAAVAVAAVALLVTIGWMAAAGTSAPGTRSAPETSTSAGASLPAASAPRASGSARAATAGERAGPARDNSDPYSAGCRADERQLDWNPVYRKDGAMFGVIALMYSSSCEAAWGYLEAPNSSKWTIHIVTQRIPGPGTDTWQFSGDVDFGSWGNVLSTQAGCVFTEAWVTDKSGQGPVSRTACMKPTP